MSPVSVPENRQVLELRAKSPDGLLEAHAFERARALRIDITAHDPTLNDSTVRIVFQSTADRPVHRTIRFLSRFDRWYQCSFAKNSR